MKERKIKEIFENAAKKDEELKEYFEDYICIENIETMKINNIIEYLKAGVVDYIDVKTPIYDEDIVKFMLKKDLFYYRVDEFFDNVNSKENFYEIFRNVIYRYLEQNFYDKLNKMVIIPLLKIKEQ